MDNLAVNKDDLHIRRRVDQECQFTAFFFGFHLYKRKKASEKKTNVRYFEDKQQHSQLLRKYLLNLSRCV